MEGQLKKLEIESYKKIDFNELVDKFTVMFNPTSYGQKYEVEYEEASGKGTSGSAQKFSRIKPQEYTFEFTIDGTGVSSKKEDVEVVIKNLLKATAEVRGDTHRPPFLKLRWGNLIVDCILKSTNITYTLFKPNGYPLRAKVSATFSQIIEDKKRTAQEGYSSPTLTHYRQVSQGDTLPLMTYRIYGDSAYYPKVAKFNGLTNFRNLETASIIAFPPLK